MPDQPFTWPVFPLPATLGTLAAVTMAVLVLMVSRRFDTTGGLLTITLLLTTAFVSVTFTAMLYDIKQGPIIDILVGALATSVGAIVAYWMSNRDK